MVCKTLLQGPLNIEYLMGMQRDYQLYLRVVKDVQCLMQIVAFGGPGMVPLDSECNSVEFPAIGVSRTLIWTQVRSKNMSQLNTSTSILFGGLSGGYIDFAEIPMFAEAGYLKIPKVIWARAHTIYLHLC